MNTLNTAIKFHGHLGPWLVLGLLMGEYALKKIRAKKHFGLEVETSGLHMRPRTCLIDGLQISTGATLGKGNIKILKSKSIFVNFINNKTNKKIRVSLNDKTLNRIESTAGHTLCEKLARMLYRKNASELFTIKNL